MNVNIRQIIVKSHIIYVPFKERKTQKKKLFQFESMLSSKNNGI